MTDIISPLKGYWCWPRGEVVAECADMVFAESREEARAIAVARQEACCECSYIEVATRREPRADQYAYDKEARERIRNGDPELWREIGGCGDPDEPRCDTCDKATMQGEYPICDNCFQCEECCDC